MATQVCTTNDILWTKFLPHSRKFSYSKINKHSKDSGNMEIGDNRNGVLLEIINNLELENKPASAKGKQMYYQIPFWRFSDLRLEKHFAESCEVFCFAFIGTLWWYAGQGSRLNEDEWRQRNRKIKLLNRKEVITQFNQFNRSLFPILFRVKWTYCAYTL